MSIYKESAVDKLKTVIQGKFMSESKINKKQDVLKDKLNNLRNEIELKKRRLITKKLKLNHLKIEAAKPQSNVQIELTKEYISTPRAFTDSVDTKQYRLPPKPVGSPITHPEIDLPKVIKSLLESSSLLYKPQF